MKSRSDGWKPGDEGQQGKTRKEEGSIRVYSKETLRDFSLIS